MQKKIYQVGGCVRDQLLNIKSNDIDLVAVGYSVEDFAHLECVGKDFPVFIDEKGREIALARVERKISNGYNGFEAITNNISLEDDLKRRDLTINSIAYDKETDTYIDPYGGKDDIKNKILRHTSHAFKEDPLRVLRLARFKAKFSDFEIDKSTIALVKTMKDELKYLQKDRVYKEIQKVFALQNSEVFFITLLELEVLDVIFPNLYNLSKCIENNIYHQEENVFVHTMMVLKYLKNESNLLKFTALFHDIAKPIVYEKTNYNNAGGHENIKLVENLLDIQVPSKLKKKMFVLIKNHIKIFNLKNMKNSTIATFFESYKKDKELFINQIIFANADENGRIGKTKEALNEELLLSLFDTISNYSVKSWIEEQDSKPSGEAIKQHIHKKNIKFVKEFLR